jgi:LuxR family maltose regulon positive regulatory protein
MHLIVPEHSENGQAAACEERADPETPVAPAKVRIPAGAPAMLVRERLHVLIDDAVTGADEAPPVIVVCAPAGTGKTAALAAWARRQSEYAVAWVSLDNEDNDPVLLWTAVLRALQVAGVCAAPRVLGRGETNPAFLASLATVFEQLSRPVVLVLDGAHEVHSASATRTLNILLRHLPPMLRVVLASRYSPPLMLPRLRIEGRLREIGPDSLAFTTEEARQLYASEGIQLSVSELEVLMERTEGWAAALRLAAITLSDAEAPSELITGDERVVADYLVGEVLDRQPDDVQQFMLSTCVCRVFTSDLAAALSKQDNAGQILDRLERTNILTTQRTDAHRWYRYHPLLRSYLRAELSRRRASAQPRLHRTAAGWFLTEGDPLRAMEHAIAAADDDLVTRLVAKYGLERVLKGEGVGLQRILDTAQPHVLCRPSVALVAAETALDLGDPLAADRYLRRIGANAQPLRTQRLRALHAVVRLHRSRLEGDVGTATFELKATRAGQTGDVDVDLLAMLNRGIAAAWAGRHQAAKRDLHRALRLAVSERRDAATLQCKAHLAAVAAAEGDLVQMSGQARAAVEFAEAHGWADTSRCTYLYTLLGAEAWERLEEDRAAQFAERAVALMTDMVDPTIELFALTLRSAVEFDDAGEPHELAAALRGHRQRLSGKAIAPSLLAYAGPIEARLALRVGEYGWAAEVQKELDELLLPCAERALLQAVLHAHRGKVSSTRRLLAPVLSGELRPMVAPTVITAWLLESHLAHRSEDAYRAHEALGQALAVAEPWGALRRFRDAGQSVRTVLAQGTGRFGRLESFAGKVLAALPASAPDLSDALTEREQALLAELPSMRTAEEIANGLFVSVNTVKTHLRGIYRKLGVNHRRDAITEARQRGLL